VRPVPSSERIRVFDGYPLDRLRGKGGERRSEREPALVRWHLFCSVSVKGEKRKKKGKNGKKEDRRRS